MKGVHLKKIGERTLAYDFGFRSPCMCEADGTCIQMKLPDRVAATDITSKYGIGIRGASRRPKGTEVVLFHLDGSIAGERTLDVSCPVFTVDERRGTAASVCSGRDTPEELVELELPSLVDKRRVPLSRSAKNERGDKPPMIGARTSRVSWAGSLLLIERPENQAVDAELFHADTVAPFARLLAFKTFGVVTFADGKLERFGQVPADYDVALVCTDGKQVAPYATCQSEVEVKGRFRVP